MHARRVVNRYTLSALVVLAAAVGVYLVFIAKHTEPAAAASSNPASSQPDTSRFSFNGATDWRKGPTNATSMALFHTNGCFTSVEYKTGTVDVAAERAKRETIDSDLGITSTPGATVTVGLQTSEGQKQYQLSQYSASGTTTDGQKVKGGQEFGYLQLSDGYIEIKGYCDTTDQLPVTIPALQAITLH